MTTRNDFSGGTVDQLLLDAGHADVPELRAALLSMASMAQIPAPAPGRELALMLAGPRDELTRKRWLRKHRPAVVGLAVLAGMGLGVSGVAATSQASGDGAGPWSVQQLTTKWAPAWTLPLPPENAAQGGRATWVSPLFLQLDRPHHTALHEPGEPAPPTAEAEAAAAGPAAPSTPAQGKDRPPASNGRAPGAAGTENPGQANHGKAGHGTVNQGNDGVGQAMTGRAPDRAGEQGDEATPDAAETGAVDAGEGAPEPDKADTDKGGTDKADTAKPRVKLGPTLDTTIDSTLDSVSSWLGKFRR